MSRPTSPPRVLIRGGGLAGTTLAWLLLRRGVDFLLWEDGRPDSSSRVAAGLITPITGQRPTVTWRWSVASARAWEFYTGLEVTLQTRFFFPGSTVRILGDDRERQRLDRCADRIQLTETTLPEPFLAPAGAVAMEPTARLDVRQYLERSQAYFENQGRLVRGRHPGGPPARGDFTIDAQGFTAELRFPRVRFAASRGEILTLRLPGVTESRTLNRLGTWLTPLQPEIYRVGSTYDRDHLSAGPTDTGAATILAKLALFYRGDYEILDHQAAVRPIIRTSQPVVGSHPDDPTLWFINGFGSKGSLLAPWVCEQLIASMLEGRPLDPELDLSFYQPPRGSDTDADHGTSP